MESQYCYGWEKGKKKDKIEVIGVEKVNVSKMLLLFVGNKVHHSISIFQYFSRFPWQSLIINICTTRYKGALKILALFSSVHHNDNPSRVWTKIVESFQEHTPKGLCITHNLLMSGIILHGTLTQLNGQKSLISWVDQILCRSCHPLKIRKSLDEKTMTERIQTKSFVSFHTQHGYFEQLISITKSNLQTD